MSTVLRVAISGTGLLLVVFSVALYHQRVSHVRRLEHLEHQLAFDHKYEDMFSRGISNWRPSIDAWNHAQSDLRVSLTSVNNAGDIITIDEKIKHLSYEQHRIDRSVWIFEAEFRDVLRGHEEVFQGDRSAKAMFGEFEQYRRSSDQLNDSASSVHGLFRLMLSAPLLGAFGDGAALGHRFVDSIFRFEHNFQTLINEQNRAVSTLKELRERDERRQREENAHWLFAA